MLNKKIDIQNSSLSFSDYFKLNIDIDELVEEFGYTYTRGKTFIKDINITQSSQNLKNQLDLVLTSIPLQSEISIREFLIAPILLDLLAQYDFKIKSEKSIYFTENLRGVLDYYIDNQKNSLVIIEAQNMDLISGVKQLAIELIALDKLIDDQSKDIYGIVTIGTNWIFVILDRKNHIIHESTKRYHLPEELDEIVSILGEILG